MNQCYFALHMHGKDKEINKFHLSKLGQNTEVTLFSNCSVIDWLLFKIKGLKKEILTEKAELSQCSS